MRVLIACERSGTVRDAFRRLGHFAASCDIEDDYSESKYGHFKADAREIATWTQGGRPYWDIVIAHPPCTYLCNSGVTWFFRNAKHMPAASRWEHLKQGAGFFKFFLGLDCERVAIENPIMHKYAKLEIWGNETTKPDQMIQPWMFGHDASKATCLWLKGLPPLMSTDIIRKKRYANQTPSGQNKLGPSKDRAQIRSQTYKGIAEAMATQWSK